MHSIINIARFHPFLGAAVNETEDGARSRMFCVLWSSSTLETKGTGSGMPDSVIGCAETRYRVSALDSRKTISPAA